MPTASIGFRIFQDHVELSYNVGPDRTAMRYDVYILHTPCHFGGYRAWFACPACGRRVGVLYGGRRFLCRHCQGFAYTTQREDRGQRAMRRWEKLTDRVEWDGDLCFKPKGMHWKTFDRLCRKIEQADLAAASSLLASFSKLSCWTSEEREKLLGHLR